MTQEILDRIEKEKNKGKKRKQILDTICTIFDDVSKNELESILEKTYKREKATVKSDYPDWPIRVCDKDGNTGGPDSGNPLNFDYFCEVNKWEFSSIYENIIVKENDEWKKCDDNFLTKIYVEAYSLVDDYRPSKEQLYMYVKHKAYNNNNNQLITEWAYSKEWDKKDRIRDLFNTLGSTDTDDFSFLGFKKWFHGFVALGLDLKFYENDPYPRQEIVLILVGPEGNGKSAWSRRICPPTPVKLIHEGELGITKDHLFRYAENLIYVASEIDTSLQSRSIGEIKEILTKSEYKCRRPYGMADTELQRRCSFIGSTNEKYFLPALEENRRFFVLDCFQERLDYTFEIDAQQLWAQVIEERKNGFQNWWSAEEQKTNTERCKRWCKEDSFELWWRESMMVCSKFENTLVTIYGNYCRWCDYSKIMPQNQNNLKNFLAKKEVKSIQDGPGRNSKYACCKKPWEDV